MARTLVMMIVGTLSLTVLGPAASAQEDTPRPVAVKVAPPFVIPSEGGGFEGISVVLWERVAEELGIEFEFRETELDELLDGVAAGRYAAGVAATTVTAPREARIDFTHPFFNGGLAIAIPTDGGGLPVIAALRSLISREFLAAVGALGVLLFAVGLLVWVAERKANRDHFGGGLTSGLAKGFWFSAVTMTTVGYGDKAPVSLPGRLIALVWMFASIIIISFFTGAIASAFTAETLSGRVSGPGDLPDARVGAVAGTTTVAALRGRGAAPVSYDDVEAGLAAVAAGELDAFVHDEPILRYAASQRRDARVRVLDAVFDRSSYALALPPGSERREAVNRALLRTITGDDWGAVVDRYLGGG